MRLYEKLYDCLAAKQDKIRQEYDSAMYWACSTHDEYGNADRIKPELTEQLKENFEKSYHQVTKEKYYLAVAFQDVLEIMGYKPYKFVECESYNQELKLLK